MVNQYAQTSLIIVTVWFLVNKLKLNVVKSLCMLVGSCQRISGKYLNLVLNGAALKQVYTTKYLGVYIDQHLTWDTHVNYVVKRVRGKLYALNRLKPVSPRLLHLIYKTFALPIFDYCDVVWSPSNAKNIRRLHSKFVSQYH